MSKVKAKKRHTGKRYRTYASDKQKRRDAVIGTEIEASQIRSKISRIKQLYPLDFRDLAIGSKDWQDMYELLLQRCEAMDAWRLGPIAYYQDLNRVEASILGDEERLRRCPKTIKLDRFLDLVALIAFAMEEHCSFIYVHDTSEKMLVTAANGLCHYFHLPVRFKSELLYDDGTRVGTLK